MRYLLLSTLLILVMVRPVFGQSETDHFSADDKHISDPATLPDGAVQILLKDESLRHALNGAKHIPPKWLLVSKIQLEGAQTTSYIAMGTGPLRSGNGAPFWVFRQRGKSTDMVLHIAAHDLIVRPTTTNRLHDIEIVSMKPGTLLIGDFRFDGARYQPHHWTNQKIK